MTFTSQRAAIPVTVCRPPDAGDRRGDVWTVTSSPSPTATRGRLTLDRPTTSVRVTAQARTSGDRLPIDVTLHDTRRPAGHRAHRPHRAFDRDLLRRRGAHRSGRRGPVGVVGPHVAAGAAPVARGPQLTRPCPARGPDASPCGPRPPTSRVGTGVSLSPGAAAASWRWPGPWARRRWPTPTTWPTPRPTCSTTSFWAASSRPPSSRSSSTAWPTTTATRPSRSISAIRHRSRLVLVVTTVAASSPAPATSSRVHRVRHPRARSDHSTSVTPSAEVATTLLRWFVIQIAAYGLFALGAALLNTCWQASSPSPGRPIVNNLVCIASWSGSGSGWRTAPRSPASGPPLPARPARPRDLPRRGAPGRRARCPACAAPTRAAPAVALEPPATTRCAPSPGSARWTFGFVVANQIALFVVTSLAGTVRRSRPGLVVHLRLRLLPAPLRRRSR